jgi:hypothetical protein
MVTAVRYPVAPSTTPRKGHLLDAATVNDGIEWLDGADLFDSYNCMKFQAEADFCAPNSKDFDQSAGWVDGFRFAAYGGVLCKSIGLDRTRLQSEVERVFNAGESTAVERALMSTRFVANAADATLPGEWAAPVDLTPVAGAVHPRVGVALLEGHAASEYVGIPTLHLPVSIASLLASVAAVEWDGDVLRTKIGSTIAAGGGYDYPNTGPTGAAAAEGEKWLYATGGVVVMRGPAEIREAFAHEDNDVFVLAERGYVAAVDCYTAAVRVQVTA